MAFEADTLHTSTPTRRHGRKYRRFGFRYSGCVLSQMQDRVLRPVSFFSGKWTQLSITIYLGNIRQRAARDYSELRDHRNLEHFWRPSNLTAGKLAELSLSEFNFKVTYSPGKDGQKPDILTRRTLVVRAAGLPWRPREASTPETTYQLDEYKESALHHL
jgi:hypothetical protein